LRAITRRTLAYPPSGARPSTGMLFSDFQGIMLGLVGLLTRLRP